ncbi:MAG: Crp/Fnr family transcriptional regulator [Boseongicola sp.]|nr:Crp/Fnr family transcriptional regulator [Boseongicola sp.]MDD9978463.1 Crp/Fnr family transcriptional regulator [Boseongicola sp.]
MKESTFKVDCSYCPIKHRAVCARCEPDELEILNEIKYYKPVAAGETVALSGERVDYVASVVSGVASLSKSLEDGRTQMVGLVLPSDFIGRPGRETIAHDVTAVTDLTLCCFHRKPFDKILEELPHVRERLLEMMFDEMDAARDWMLLLGRKTAREKIASFLVLMVNRSTLPKELFIAPVRVDLPISRDAIANFLGLTIETVSRQLTALRKDGIISLEGNREVIIPDFQALKDEAGLSD